MNEQQPDVAVHLVGQPDANECEKEPMMSFESNVKSTLTLLEAMRTSSCKRMIFTSTAMVYGPRVEPLREEDSPTPMNTYGHHKLIAEQLIRGYENEYGLSCTILRLFNVYGNDPWLGKDVLSIFVRRALQGEPIIVRGGSGYRDFVYVGDVARAICATLDRGTPKTTLNIGTGTKLTIRELADIVKERCEKVRIVETEGPTYGLYADISRARETLGFSPEHPRKRIPLFIDEVTRVKDPPPNELTRVNNDLVTDRCDSS